MPSNANYCASNTLKKYSRTFSQLLGALLDMKSVVEDRLASSRLISGFSGMWDPVGLALTVMEQTT